jgi:hypothetical protein
MYGQPTKETARRSSRCCAPVTSGRTSCSAAERICSCSQPDSSSRRAREYAASARVAGSFRPSRGCPRRQVVDPEAEQPSDRLRSHAGLRCDARVVERGGMRRAESPRPRKPTSGVELADRDRAARRDSRVAVVDGLRRRERERLQRSGERALGQGLLRLEAGDRVGQEAGLDHRLDLGLRPGAVRRGGGRDEPEADEAEEGEAPHAPSIGSSSVRLEADKRCQRRV